VALGICSRCGSDDGSVCILGGTYLVAFSEVFVCEECRRLARSLFAEKQKKELIEGLKGRRAKED
jgi:hypothetical protein